MTLYDDMLELEAQVRAFGRLLLARASKRAKSLLGRPIAATDDQVEWAGGDSYPVATFHYDPPPVDVPPRRLQEGDLIYGYGPGGELRAIGRVGPAYPREDVARFEIKTDVAAPAADDLNQALEETDR